MDNGQENLNACVTHGTLCGKHRMVSKISPPVQDARSPLLLLVALVVPTLRVMSLVPGPCLMIKPGQFILKLPPWVSYIMLDMNCDLYFVRLHSSSDITKAKQIRFPSLVSPLVVLPPCLLELQEPK